MENRINLLRAHTVDREIERCYLIKVSIIGWGLHHWRQTGSLQQPIGVQDQVLQVIAQLARLVVAMASCHPQIRLAKHLKLHFQAALATLEVELVLLYSLDGVACPETTDGQRVDILERQVSNIGQWVTSVVHPDSALSASCAVQQRTLDVHMRLVYD